MKKEESAAETRIAQPALPVHLAFYWLGAAEKRPDGVAVRGEVGPYVECLADVVDRVTVLAHDTPATPTGPEDVADYLARPVRGNIDVLSLGPNGDWRDYLQRKKRVKSIVQAASGGWDILLLRFDRRAQMVFRASVCPRSIAMVHGHSGAVAESVSLTERVRGIPFRLRARWNLRRIVRGSGLFVTDGEECLSTWGRYALHGELIRHSIRRARWTHFASDRLVGPTYRFLFVGRLNSMKRIRETIEAFAQLRDQLLPSAVLDVVGEGPDLDAVIQLTRRRGIADAVTFHGSLAPGERLYGLYRNADVLLLLSRAESFPRVITEAMANSVLVVGTAVGSLPLAFRPNREMMFVEPRPESVVRAVRTLLQDADLRRAMITHGHAWAEETSVEKGVHALVNAIVRRWPELGSPSYRHNGGLPSP